ncbi:SDR family oxidoreductase [Nodularia harveyana UHCC-0300]|uniref:dTDP-4-dehydrorhamnose reductase n=1 Tax=Nodularia harveyana UHCC-0300 TaxID=2974287 RepID=A0ABU5UDL6_9CYAN|nr:SDR family oxidoreductase [Nodularia harveyana]MEA5581259.1 SDR family oxidoreductase [Nodularia harveyana UHCC-0300]
MRILVTGAAGLIGKKMTSYLSSIGYDVIPVDCVEHKGIVCADLRDESAVFRIFNEQTPDLIIHLAAIKNIKLCEENKEASRATNYGIPEVLTRICSESKIRMIFFSSDYVFGKYDHFWKEGDSPCPTTQYGIDKAASEFLIQEKLSDYAIIRTAQLYGFRGDFVSLVWDALSSNQEFLAFANLVNCPTWIDDLLAMLNKIICQGSQGIFHCVGPEALSRYQYACAVAEAFSLDTSYIKAVNLDFSTDIRPPVVRLNGTSTYDSLQVYPGTLKDNLSFCSSYTIQRV